MGIVVVSRAQVEPLLEEFREAGLGVTCSCPRRCCCPGPANAKPGCLSTTRSLPAGCLCRLRLQPPKPRTGGCNARSWVPGNSATPGTRGGTAPISSMEAALESPRPGLQVEIKPVDSVSGWMASVLPSEPLNLLQGDLRPALRWRHYWHDWKPVAIAALAAVLGELRSADLSLFQRSRGRDGAGGQKIRARS